MTWQWTPYTLPVALTALGSVLGALYMRRRRDVPGGEMVVFLLLAGAVWAFAYAMELSSALLPGKLLWAKLQYFGIVFLPLIYLVFITRYTGWRDAVKTPVIALLSVVPLLTLVLVFTNESHGLIWGRTELARSGAFVMLSQENGPAKLAFLAYAVLLTLAATGLLLLMGLRSRRFYRWQVSLIAIVGVMPLVTIMLELLRITPLPGFEPTPMAFNLSVLAVSWGLSRFRRGELVWVSRRAVFENMSDPILVLDERNRILDLNQAAHSLLGRPPSKVMEHHIAEAWPELFEHMLRARDAAAPGQPQDMAFENRSGSKAYDVLISPLTDTEDRLVSQVVVLRDITQRKRAEEQLLHDALHDRLTGLPNRTLFMDRLNQALRRTKRHPESQCAVLFMDLDRFKVVNDSLGHVMGDQLLVDVAHRLKGSMREVDTFARLGGDEFVVLLEDIHGVVDGIRAARRIQKLLKEGFLLGGRDVAASASIGIVLVSEHYDDPEDLLRDADLAMYRAKDLGRARYAVFDKDMHNRAMSMLQLESDLRGALQRGEFELHYQPIISFKDSAVIGFEALVRWNHPHQGQIHPKEFIPVAEESELIIPLGKWVLLEACRQMAAWQAGYPQDTPMTVSVNISGKQLKSGVLIEHVREALRSSGLQASSLVLEITESAIIGDAEGVSETFGRLKEIGVQLHLDDFGTGYSSLSLLRRFPFDTLKIDQSFVSGVVSSNGNQEIIRTIVSLAQNLNKEAIAEGIEGEGQLEHLKGLECELGQGYFFSRPLDSEAATTLIAEGPAHPESAPSGPQSQA